MMKRCLRVLFLLLLPAALLTSAGAAVSTVRLVSVNMTTGGSGNAPAGLRVSADGRSVIFASRAGNLVPGDPNATRTSTSATSPRAEPRSSR